MKEVTIVVNSCDRYYQAWEILAYSYKKYWPDCPWDILFMTNRLEAPMGTSTKIEGSSNWTYMMRETLNQVETPYVMLVLDDYFLTDYVNTKMLLDYVKTMSRDNITHLRLLPATDGIQNYYNDERFKIVKKDSLYRTSLAPAIWNKNHFKSFLKTDENMWEFETQGRFREMGLYLILSVKEHTYLCLEQDNPTPKWYGQKSIERGEWCEGALTYIREEGLNINTSLNPKDVNVNNLTEYLPRVISNEIKTEENIKINDRAQVSIEEIKVASIVQPQPKFTFEPAKKNAIKILWLYQYMKDVNYDHWFHIDFARAISEHKEAYLKCYGLNMDIAYPDISLQYNSQKLLSDIKAEFNFDIIISNTKSRMFKYYCPPVLEIEERRGCWLPRDFAKWNKTPKISLEEDYHYEVSDSWYVENNVDLLLQRHWSQAQRKEHIKKIWYPFSVDNIIFSPKNQSRKRKLCNLASSSSNCYPHRYKLIQMLEPYNLLHDAKRSIENNDYLNWLQAYVSYICCDSIYHITPAKMFEIMASGGLLFTSNSANYGLQELFPKNSYFTYEEDYSDVKEKVHSIINDVELVNQTVKNALKCIEKRHTNSIRIDELLKIIHNEFKI